MNESYIPKIGQKDLEVIGVKNAIDMVAVGEAVFTFSPDDKPDISFTNANTKAERTKVPKPIGFVDANDASAFKAEKFSPEDAIPFAKITRETFAGK
ncbi:MAG: hypothetical protein Q8P25_04180 [Candidatus Curtissbacteria bacterium]|nr:hypothetical protein [Candidatus Curtissbacteria bacterium]